MKIVKKRAFEGRNIYSHKKCIRIDVDLEGYSEIPSKDIKDFNISLVKYVPELAMHRCGIDEEGGFIKRLEEGTYLAHICEHVILSLQNRIGIDVCYGKSRVINGDMYYIIFQYEYKDTAFECANCAVDLINSLIHNNKIDIESKMENIKQILSREKIGPSTSVILEEARRRGIPYIKVGEESIYQLGYGKYSRMIEATICSSTSGVGIDIASDKLLTKQMLDDEYLPVAEGGKVRDAFDVLLKAQCIGYPVVLKPRYGNHGRGVIVNIKDNEEVVKAYKTLTEKFNCKDIIIEKYIKGRDYRICMVDGKVAAAAERIPPFITGDGVHTVNELIQELNNDENRGEGHEKPLTRVQMDDEVIDCIKSEGCTLQSVLLRGRNLYLRRNCNLSTGGMSIDCTDMLCSENVEICERCAKTIGLDICGIDICCSDISKPIDGAILEVNAAPGIRMHHYPWRGKKRNVAGSIIDMLFKDDARAIPITAVTGTNGKTTTSRLIAHVLEMKGYNVGMAVTGGIYINGRCIAKGDTTGYDSARTILMNKSVDCAVLECARGGLIRRGLAYDLADVGVITNITNDHLGIDGINSIDELAKVKSLVWEAVKEDGYCVVNGDDKMSLSVLHRIKSKVIVFSKDRNNPILRKAIQKGSFGIYIFDNVMYAESGKGIYPVIKVNDIKITLNGVLTYNIENAMAACAALVGLGVDCSVIGKGFASFYGDESCNPGRFNMYNVNGATIVLDYGHNIEGYKAVLSGAKMLKHRRLVGIIGVPGDRNDKSVIELGNIAGSNFDYIYIKEDKDKRGRRPGEISEILQSGVKESGFPMNNVSIILDEEEALKTAIDNALPGDLIIIFFEKYEPLLNLVKMKMSSKTPKTEAAFMA